MIVYIIEIQWKEEKFFFDKRIKQSMKIKTIKQNLSLLLSCVLILTNVANTYALSSISADKDINITAREITQANVVYVK